MPSKKPDERDVAYCMLGIRITGAERVGLDILAERESAQLRARLEAAGIPPKMIAPLAAPTIVRGWIQREIEAAGLDLADLKTRAETAYPRRAAPARPRAEDAAGSAPGVPDRGRGEPPAARPRAPAPRSAPAAKRAPAAGRAAKQAPKKGGQPARKPKR
jgi:hypothetical protein